VEITQALFEPIGLTKARRLTLDTGADEGHNGVLGRFLIWNLGSQRMHTLIDGPS
jgi:hypothetical protein